MRDNGLREMVLSPLDQTATRCNHSLQQQAMACARFAKRSSTATSSSVEWLVFDRAMIKLTSATHLVWLASRFRHLTIESPNENP